MVETNVAAGPGLSRSIQSDDSYFQCAPRVRCQTGLDRHQRRTGARLRVRLLLSVRSSPDLERCLGQVRKQDRMSSSAWLRRLLPLGLLATAGGTLMYFAGSP